MDSAHSGSLNSSSGGDDEYSSRAAAPNSLSSLLHPRPLFDPLSDFFIDSSTWANSPRPDPNNLPMFNPSPAPDTTVGPAVIPTRPATSSSPAGASRNPRKRSRASRRAPTTVLTTDTSNFRAMVQEFTGIPAPPFASSPFSRAKLDLFGAPSSIGSGSSSFLLRPFPQKYQPPQLPLQLPSSYQNQSQGLMNFRNDPVFSFHSLINQPNASSGQSELRGNVQNLVSSEGNLDILHEERGPNPQNVMEPWLCSSENR